MNRFSNNETDLDTDLKYAVLEREFMIEAMTMIIRVMLTLRPEPK